MTGADDIWWQHPSARVETLHNAGHFPYLNQPKTYPMRC